MPKVFSVMAHAQKTKIPPNPPLEKGDLKISLWNEFMANAITAW
jgi:hypothetical protein